MRIFGVTGWKNAGKTGLMERLIDDITARGFSVSTLKHAHHNFDVDQPGRDSFRHRAAGAEQVLLSSGKRWALMTELCEAPEPALADLLAQMAPVDLILIEGWKREPHPKVEAWRKDAANPLIAPDDPTIVAVASDTGLDVDRPQFDLDDTAAIADFILDHVGLPRQRALVDRVFCVDWSSDSKRGPAQPKSDAIYMADMNGDGQCETTYHRSRFDAFDTLCDRLTTALAQRQQVVLGFDFAFGYPTGFAEHLTGAADAKSVWKWMAQHVSDGPDNSNNRFDVAATINRSLDGDGPFWGHHTAHQFDGMTRFKPENPSLPDRRSVETVVPKAQSVWKLFTPGSVGSQVLMGMPYLHRLAMRFGDKIAFWPFDTHTAPITCLEIYPSLYGIPDHHADEDQIYKHKDARQVRTVCREIFERSAKGDFLSTTGLPRHVTAEEGWIFDAPFPESAA